MEAFALLFISSFVQCGDMLHLPFYPTLSLPHIRTGPFRIKTKRVGERRCNQCAIRAAQLLRVAIKVAACNGFYAINAIPHFYAIQIYLHNAIF